MGVIPEWATERAIALQTAEGMPQTPEYQAGCYSTRAFARYIAEHEEPPFAQEAKRLIAEVYGPTEYMGGEPMPGDGPARVRAILGGKGDEYWEVRLALAALRRGMELASPGAGAAGEGAGHG